LEYHISHQRCKSQRITPKIADCSISEHMFNYTHQPNGGGFIMWRHGDVLIAEIGKIPEGATRLTHTTLARGEVTGHSHRIADPKTAELWQIDGLLYLKVIAPTATLIHEEHQPITFPQGIYRVWMQREYTPQAIRRVVD
jgi:hypothetical protein